MSTPATRSGRHRTQARRSPVLWSELVTMVRRPTVVGRPSHRGLVKTAGALVAAVGAVSAWSASPVSAVSFDLTSAPTAEVAATTVRAPQAALAARPSYGEIGFKAIPRTSADPLAQGVSRGIRTSGLRGELGLTQHALVVLNAVRDNFPQIHSYGGYRPGDMDHGTGNAVDVMISSKAQGDAVAAYVMAHAAALDVKYVIWQQRIWYPSSGTWKGMADRGSPTANHMDHVHVSVH